MIFNFTQNQKEVGSQLFSDYFIAEKITKVHERDDTIGQFQLF